MRKRDTALSAIYQGSAQTNGSGGLAVHVGRYLRLLVAGVEDGPVVRTEYGLQFREAVFQQLPTTFALFLIGPDGWRELRNLQLLGLDLVLQRGNLGV